MLFHHFQHTRKLVVFTLMTTILSGCGAPNFSTMKPTVTKPAAKILLVNHPSGWTKSSVSRLHQNDSVLEPMPLSVRLLSSSQLQSQITQTAKQKDVSLCVVVFPGTIPESAVKAASQYHQMNFEFIGTAPAQSSSTNVAQLVPNEEIPAYIAGWLAGSVKQPKGSHTIGVLTNGAQHLSKQMTEALLAGLYTADPTAVLQPDTKFPVAQNPSPGNTVPSAPPVKPTVPAVNIEVTALSAQNQALLAKGKGVVFSGVSAPGSAVVMQPGPPKPAAVVHDLQSVVRHNWKHGVRLSEVSPAIQLSNSHLPAGTKHALAQLSVSNVTKKYVSAAWSGVPTSVQTKWLGKLHL